VTSTAVRTLVPFTRPLAYAYQFYAFPLGLLAPHPAAADWVLSNYLQVVHERDGDSAPVPFAFHVHDYTVSPWLETLRLSREWVSLQERGITGTVRDALGSGFAVYLTLNERHVPRRRAYRDRDYPHDVLIRGLDDEQGSFDLYGYDERLRFEPTRMPQADLPAAYHDTGPGPFHDVPLTLYRYDPAGRYTFDLDFIARGLAEYLDSVNTSAHFQAQRDPWDRVYGMRTYDLLADHLAGCAGGAVRGDIRGLQVLWEHKRVMVARMARCAELVPPVGDLIAEYRRVERAAWTLRTMLLARRSGRPVGDFGTRCAAILAGMRHTEDRLLTAFAAQISRRRAASTPA
jgi:hypothetical protein